MWRFGLSPASGGDWLQAYCWRPVEDVGYDELRRANRGAMSVERLVQAEKQ